MQDIQSLVGGRMFERIPRSIRRHNHLQNHQLLKCPRCDSSNTKFCYYNNYNLSQPRHFCKNCRRYWTKGGVLRNIPVGGGCRKSKRSKARRSASPPQTASLEKSSAEISSVPSTDDNGVDSVLPCSHVFQIPLPELRCEARRLTEMESISGLMTSPVDGVGELLSEENFEYVDMNPHLYWQHQLLTQKLDGRVGMEGFGAIDWRIHEDQGTLDLPMAIDHAYWNMGQWSDQAP